eukprot:gene7980-7378_t
MKQLVPVGSLDACSLWDLPSKVAPDGVVHLVVKAANTNWVFAQVTPGQLYCSGDGKAVSHLILCVEERPCGCPVPVPPALTALESSEDVGTVTFLSARQDFPAGTDMAGLQNFHGDQWQPFGSSTVLTYEVCSLPGVEIQTVSLGLCDLPFDAVQSSTALSTGVYGVHKHGVAIQGCQEVSFKILSEAPLREVVYGIATANHTGLGKTLGPAFARYKLLANPLGQHDRAI